MAGPIVSVQQGLLQGTTGKDFDGNSFYKFLGIPYAKPPVGELRFKEPSPHNPWEGIRDASKEGGECIATNMVTQQLEGSEDCLYLNVYTRELSSENGHLKPVMVFIHGGAFTAGSASQIMYGAEYLLTQDIVLVTINYRLGILGFLQLKDSSMGISGNAGLKDQTAALRWIKSNIDCFNGDPKNITIFGESAGSASVHLHILSPMSRDLFHKGIMQSGVALNDFVICNHNAVDVAKIEDPSVTNEKEAYDLLKGLPAETLHKLQVQYELINQSTHIKAWGPVIEELGTQKPVFLPEHPFKIIKEGNYNKVPMIFGYNNREGMLYDLYKKYRPPGPFEISRAIHPYLKIAKTSETYKNILKKIENLYFKGGDRDDEIRVLLTDSEFLAGIIASIKCHLSTSPYPIYLYRMTLETSLNVMKRIIGLQKAYGACHADDIGYLFNSVLSSNKLVPGSPEEVGIRRFVKLWTNFAKYGDPTPENDTIDHLVWKKVLKSHLSFLNIGDELTLECNPEPERMALWREIFHHTSDHRYM